MVILNFIFPPPAIGDVGIELCVHFPLGLHLFFFLQMNPEGHCLFMKHFFPDTKGSTAAAGGVTIEEPGIISGIEVCVHFPLVFHLFNFLQIYPDGH